MSLDTGIDCLIKAANYLDWKDREAEHGYASTQPVAMVEDEEYVRSRRPNKHRKSQGNRSTHNELEKNRRAHLRHCLEKLKEMVPLGPDSTRHTTLGLLTKSKAFIKALEEKEKRQGGERFRLAREKKLLQIRLEQLSNGLNNGYRLQRVERSISECSSSNISTSSTSSYESYESDEVDILGYGSSEDDSSIHSSLSESGCTVDAGKLSIRDQL